MTGGQWFGILLMLTGAAVCAVPFIDQLIDNLALVITAFVLGVVLVIAGALLTFSDNPHHLHSGVVIGKKFTPAHTTWTTQCVSTGKTTICHPQPVFVEDDWTLKLRNCEHDGKCETGTLHFDNSRTWDRYAVGAHYPAAS